MTKFLITSLIAGLLLGLAFAGTDLFNPQTAAAEANRLYIDAQHQQAMNQLQERLATAETEAELREIQRQQALLDAQHQRDILLLAQEPAQRDAAFRTRMFILALIGGALAITLSVISILWVGSRVWVDIRSTPPKETPMAKAIPTIEKKISVRESYDPLEARAILYGKRLDERLQELANEYAEPSEDELLAARMKALARDTNPGRGVYKKRPLAR